MKNLPNKIECLNLDLPHDETVGENLNELAQTINSLIDYLAERDGEKEVCGKLMPNSSLWATNFTTFCQNLKPCPIHDEKKGDYNPFDLSTPITPGYITSNAGTAGTSINKPSPQPTEPRCKNSPHCSHNTTGRDLDKPCSIEFKPTEQEWEKEFDCTFFFTDELLSNGSKRFTLSFSMENLKEYIRKRISSTRLTTQKEERAKIRQMINKETQKYPKLPEIVWGMIDNILSHLTQ